MTSTFIPKIDLSELLERKPTLRDIYSRDKSPISPHRQLAYSLSGADTSYWINNNNLV